MISNAVRRSGWMGLALGLASCLLAAEPSSPRRDPTVVAVEKAIPGVVNISVKTVVQRRALAYDWFRDFWSPFYHQAPVESSSGSGVIIDEEGYVLTNAHVVEQASEILVRLHDDTVLPAELVVGTRKSDVALLKLKPSRGRTFQPIEFAAADDLLLGEPVIALGNPFGLGVSVSKGILSSKTRRKESDSRELDIQDWLQTDAAINPGNSGGPLLNLDGNLIGLNVAIYKEAQGIGFAIPVKRINEALAEIFSPESLRGLWLGARFGMSGGRIAATEVESESPAAKAGLKPGDVVVRVGERAPRSVIGLVGEVLAQNAKGGVSLVVQRNWERKILKPKLQPLADIFNAEMVRKRLGLGLRVITPEMAAAGRLPVSEGLVVTAIDQGSPADHAGFQEGLVIESIDGLVPKEMVALARHLHRRKSGESIELTLLVPRPLRRATVALTLR